MLERFFDKLANLILGPIPETKENKKVYDLIVNLSTWDLAKYLHAMQSSEKTEVEIMDILETCVEEIICNEDVCDTCPCNFENGCLLYGMPTR